MRQESLPGEPSRIVKLGLRSQTLTQYTGRLLASVVAQYYGLVQDGMVFARHVFRGLERPLNHADNMNADRDVLCILGVPRLTMNG